MVLDLLLGAWGSLFRGAWCAVRATMLALRNAEARTTVCAYLPVLAHIVHTSSSTHTSQQVRRVHRQLLLPLICIALPAYALLVLPARLLLSALRFRALALALDRFSAATTRLIPLVINLGLRFLFYTPLDRAYLAVLADLDPTLATQLRTRPPWSRREALWKEATRLVRLLTFLPLYVFLSLIPVVGRVLKWAFKVRKTASID